MKSLPLSLLLLLLSLVVSEADNYHTLFVSPTGKKEAKGTKDDPIQSIQGALQRLRKMPQPHRIYLSGGVYYLEAPLVFTSQDSGSKKNPLIISALSSLEGERPVISGGYPLNNSNWKPADGFPKGVLVYSLPKDLHFPMNGNEMLQVLAKADESAPRLHLARTPNYDAKVAIFGGYSKDCLSPKKIATWSDPTGGIIHSLHAREWGDNHWKIVGKNSNGTLKMQGGWMNNRPSGLNGIFRFVENIKEELDAPGEWWIDSKSKQLYFFPPKGMDLKSTQLVLSRLERLIEMKGDSVKNPVQHIKIQGVDFAHSTRTFMKTKEPLLRSDWKIYRGGALFFENVSDISMNHCDLYDLGGNAVMVSSYANQWTINDAHITRVGASGVCFVGSPKAVRSPSFNYFQTVPYDKLDKEKGPKTQDYPRDCVVQNCLLHDLGRTEKQCAAVQISMANRIKIKQCSIYDMPRAGINIGDGCWGGHVIDACDVFDTVKMTGDHGSFNSWGRDRYWLCNSGQMNRLVEQHPELTLLDAMEQTVIRNSRWSCQHGWGIDLDDGSSNYLLEKNLVLSGGIKFREGFHRIARSNICINCGFHTHVWFKNSEDVIESNIVSSDYKAIRIPKWGKSVDRNFFLYEEDLKEARKRGIDAHSLWGNPQFVDPEKGNFQVKPTSPALTLGFESFPMQFGVQSARLKPLAQTPQIPRIVVNKDKKLKSYTWLGGKLCLVQGGSMRSAVGLGKDEGLLVLQSAYYFPKAIKVGDVILAIDGKTINSFQDLEKAWGKKSKTLKVTIFRNQKKMECQIRR